MPHWANSHEFFPIFLRFLVNFLGDFLNWFLNTVFCMLLQSFRMVLVVVFYNVGFRVLAARALPWIDAVQCTFSRWFCPRQNFFMQREGKLGLDSLRCTNWMIVFPTHTTLLNGGAVGRRVGFFFCVWKNRRPSFLAEIPLRVIPDFAFTTENLLSSLSLQSSISGFDGFQGRRDNLVNGYWRHYR